MLTTPALQLFLVAVASGTALSPLAPPPLAPPLPSAPPAPPPPPVGPLAHTGYNCRAPHNSTILCAAGSAPVSGVCTACTPGKASESGRECVKCLHGKYTGSGGSTCTSCPINQTTSTDGATGAAQCSGCGAGHYGFPGIQCVPCKQGSWNTLPAAAACTFCPAGFATGSVTTDVSTDLSSNCTRCGAGESPADAGGILSRNHGGASCESCLGGAGARFESWGTPGAPGSCSLCPPFTFLPQSSRFHAMLAGGTAMYPAITSIDWSANCTSDCSVDTANNSSLMSSVFATCITAADGDVERDDGTYLGPCEAGHVRNNVACAYKPAGDPLAGRYACEDLRASSAIGAADLDHSCVACAAGKFALPGAYECYDCPAGETSTAGSGGCALPADMNTCPAGQVSMPPVGNYDCALQFLLRGHAMSTWNGAGFPSWGCDDLLGALQSAGAGITNAYIPGLARMCLPALIRLADRAPASWGMSHQLRALADETLAKWGQDDDSLLQQVHAFGGTGGLYPLVQHQMSPLAFGCAAHEAMRSSGEGFSYPKRIHNEKYNADEPCNAFTCADPRFVSDWCAYPLFAISCPARCGGIPSSAITCSAPGVFVTTAGTNLERTWDFTKPIMPPSMALNCLASWAFNTTTRLIEPRCVATHPPSPPTAKGKSNAAAIAGGAVGGVFLIALVAAVVLTLAKKNKAKKTMPA